MNIAQKWNVSKYASWDYSTCKWRVPIRTLEAPSTLMLILKGTQFLLIANKTVIESFNIIQKEEGSNVLVRNGCMALVVKCGGKYRKFKILFNSPKEAEDCAGFLQKYIRTEVMKLEATEAFNNNDNHGQVKGYDSASGGPKTTAAGGPSCSGGPKTTAEETQTLPEMLERIMSNMKPSLSAPDSIPEDFPLESAVRLCILDPGFPKLVEKVETIINNRYK